MKTGNARLAIVLAGILLLGWGAVAERASAEAQAGFAQAELDQMLAPIALYPDTVLSHVLIAATYPLEVVRAARWSRANPGLEGEYAVAAVEHYPWDPSVMALVAFPELLARMDADLDWTQRLGDAFLIQEYQVLDTVQYLRDEAYASGHLRSNEYVRVVRETEYIYIEPSVTRVVYVPWYDPYTVYGNWRWSAYPPVYWHQPRGYRSGFSFHWGTGHHLQYGFFFSAVHWPSHRLMIHDHHGYYGRHDNHYGKRYGKHGHKDRRFTSGRELAGYKGARHWKHDPDHRRGVAYRRGIDERHTRRASHGSRAAGRSHGYDSSRNNRRDLLRQRSRSTKVPTRRSASASVDTDRRDRQAAERTIRNRNSIRRDANRILGAAPSEPAASDLRGKVASGRFGGSPRNASAGRSATNRGARRRDLAQRRAPMGKPPSRTNAREAASNRERGAQSAARSSSQSIQLSSRQASRQASARSRSSQNSRAVDSQTRPSADSRGPVTRGARQTTSRTTPARVEKQARQAHLSSRSGRADASKQARSRGKSSRAEVLRNRDRKK